MPHANEFHTTTPHETSRMQTVVNPVSKSSAYHPWAGFRDPQPGVIPVRTMWKGTVLVDNAEGHKESFAIGPDGYIWSFEMAGEGYAAGRLVSTGLAGDVFALGKAGGGLMAVIAAGDDGRLSFVMESYDPGCRWSVPQSLPFPGRHEIVDIEKIITQSRGDNLFIGVIVHQRNANGSYSRRLWEAVWAGDRPVLAGAPVAIACGHAFWRDQLSMDGERLN